MLEGVLEVRMEIFRLCCLLAGTLDDICLLAGTLDDNILKFRIKLINRVA